MLNIDNQTSSIIDLELLNKIYLTLLKKEEKETKDVDLLLLDEGRIREYNRKYRGKDSVTDVISFSAELDFLPTYGDIIIDISVADMQKGNKDLQSEINELFVHGVLHLLGYDHLSAKGKKIMNKKEEEYIKSI